MDFLMKTGPAKAGPSTSGRYSAHRTPRRPRRLHVQVSHILDAETRDIFIVHVRIVLARLPKAKPTKTLSDKGIGGLSSTLIVFVVSCRKCVGWDFNQSLHQPK